MAAVTSLCVKGYLRLSFGAALLLAPASTMWAQPVTQDLTIGFQSLGPTVSAAVIPLSNWSTAGIALLVALTAFIMFRRQKARGGRFFGLMLVSIAAAGVLGTTSERLITEARAAGPVAIIDLSISPTLNVAPFLPNPTVTAVVNNTTGQSVRITSITLAPGTYGVSIPTTCTVGSVLVASATCTITLAAS